MKVLICSIAVLIAACSAEHIDVRSGGIGAQQSTAAETFNGNVHHQQQPIVRELRVIEVVRQNNQDVSTVVKNIKVVHDAHHPKLHDVKAIHVFHQTQQPGPHAVKTIQIVHQQQESPEVETIQLLHEQADSLTDYNDIHGNEGSAAVGDYSGGSTGGNFYDAASNNVYSGISESNDDYSNAGTSAGYFYGGASDSAYGRFSYDGDSDVRYGGSYDGTSASVLEILQSL